MCVYINILMYLIAQFAKRYKEGLRGPELIHARSFMNMVTDVRKK